MRSSESVTGANALPELVDVDLTTNIRVLIRACRLGAPSPLKLRRPPSLRDHPAAIDTLALGLVHAPSLAATTDDNAEPRSRPVAHSALNAAAQEGVHVGGLRASLPLDRPQKHIEAGRLGPPRCAFQ